jgi:uncharacterized protein (DUF433 family)
MAAVTENHSTEPWRKRLYLPNYQVGEVARYAGISSQTVASWHRFGSTLSSKDRRSALSYLQLIEVAVVAAFRKAGVSLRRIRDARAYVSKELKSKFPFADYRFKTNGKRLWIDYAEIEGDKGKGKLLGVDRLGQLAWGEILGRLQEFEYENGGLAIRWRVCGPNSPVVIDPRVSFGAPSVTGTPTWVIKGRWDAGESPSEIADDFNLNVPAVREALKFEGIIPGAQQQKWIQ